MIRRTRDANPVFLLSTDHSSYAMRVLPTGQLEHIYYGPRLEVSSVRSLAVLAEQRAFAPGNTICYDEAHPELSLEDVCLEYASTGKGDIREPMVELVLPDGGRTSDFIYQDSVLSETKPAYSTLPGSYSESGRVEHLCIFLQERYAPLQLELHYYVYPECICRSVRLINRGTQTVEIERLLSQQLDLYGDAYMVSCFHGAWAREMQRSCVAVPAGKFVMGSTAGSSSNRMNPFFMVHTADTTETQGVCYGFNLIYSGNHYACVEASAFGKTRIVSGIHPQGFRYLLQAGEAFEAPEAVLCYSETGFSGVSQAMHRFVREHIVRGRWKKKPRPVLLNSWEASYFDISESSLLSLARAGREIGVELFVVDDGWFGERSDDTRSLGDWEPNPAKLPGGLAALGKAVVELGMQFGIWVEPEMLNVQSRLYENHPEYAMCNPSRDHAEGRHERVLDLASAEVQGFVIEKMSEVFSSAPISYVKWDYNRIFSDVYAPSLPPAQQGEAAHRNICGLYAIMEALTQRFPDILFEGCASGGGRFDLGMLCYFPQIWASDNTDAICRAHIQTGYSYGYPMSTVSAHVSACPNHQTLRRTPVETRFAVAAFGVLGYELDLRDLSAAQKRVLKEQIDLYLLWRDVLQYGDFYRTDGNGFLSWTCVSRDKKRAVGLIVQELMQPNTPSTGPYIPRGLDPSYQYRFYNLPKKLNIKLFGSLINMMSPVHVRPDSLVHNTIAKATALPGESEDFVMSGDMLMRSGVHIKPAFAGTGISENVRLFQDFASRLYFMQAQG